MKIKLKSLDIDEPDEVVYEEPTKVCEKKLYKLHVSSLYGIKYHKDCLVNFCCYFFFMSV